MGKEGRVGKRFDKANRAAAKARQAKGQSGWEKGTSRRNKRKKN